MYHKPNNFKKRHSHKAHNKLAIATVIVGIGLAFFILNGTFHIKDQQVCLSATPDRFSELHCEDVLR